jgi:tetratricopeptide (TPR) repeat protein
MSPGGCGGEAGDMGELARGSVADRPWGRTFATLGLRGLTGQLTLVSDAKRFVVAFEAGAVVAAASPLASDAAVRVALTSHLVSSSQVPEISRRQAAAPERDEIELIAELARLGPDHALRLRRRVIAQRAARTFSINHGEFVVTDQTELTILPGCELDARAVVYLGARANLPEQRLSAELDQLGSRFRLRPAQDDDLPQFGFTDLEQPVIERLRDGGTIAEIEEFATSFVDGRTVRAVVYALAVCNACERAPVRPAVVQARSGTPTPPPMSTAGGHATSPRAPTATQPGTAAPGAPRAVERTGPQPLPRAEGSPEAPRPARPRPAAAARRAPTLTPPVPAEAPRAAGPTPAPVARRTPTLTPPVPAEAPRAVGPTPAPAESPRAGLLVPRPGLAARSATSTPARALPTLRGPASSPPPGKVLELATGSAAYRPLGDGLDAPTQRDAASPMMQLTLEQAAPRDWQGLDVPAPRQGSSPALRLRLEEEAPRQGSSPALRLPGEAEARREGSNPALRSPFDEAMPHDVSSPALRRSIDDVELPPPEPVILRVPSSRPPPQPRQVQRADSPRSHDVKALIAQRLKLLDQGADHFQLLGVAQDVSADLLRKAYFALARQLHPDRLAALGISDDGKHAQRLFAQINAGFAILSDDTRRADYLGVLSRGGEAAVRAEQARAEEMARRILDAEEAFHRGELALKRDQPRVAVTELEVAVRLHPDEADYHALLAWAQFCAAPDKMAIASATRLSLDKAIQRSPRAVSARFYLGRVERMLGRDQEALRLFRDVLAAAPGHTDAAAELRVLEARLASGDKPGGGLFGRPKR